MKRICEFGIILRIIKIFENIMKMFAKHYFSYQTLLPSLCNINDSLESHTKDQIHLKNTQIVWNCMIQRQILQNSQENECAASDK